MDILQDIKPLSTFKQNAAKIIANIKATKRPTIITINGNAEIVIQDAETYQEMINIIEHFKNIQCIQKGLDDVKNNNLIEAKKGFIEFKGKYKI
jgi:PHD/YefM family antitoxin component YafN of YafNO toxin-antitoxin module